MKMLRPIQGVAKPTRTASQWGFILRRSDSKPEYLLAMKLKALERVTADDRDFQDAARIGAEWGIASVDQMLNVFQRFFGDEALSVTARLRLSELIEAIQARPA